MQNKEGVVIEDFEYFGGSSCSLCRQASNVFYFWMKIAEDFEPWKDMEGCSSRDFDSTGIERVFGMK